MAYTYNDFLNAANSSGVLDKFSQEDLTVAQKSPEYGLSMVSLMKDLAGATTAEQRLLATEAANQLRKNYGVYSNGNTYAGSVGSSINKLQNELQNYGSFNYAGQEQLQQAQNAANNFGSFNYAGQDQLQQTQDAVNNYGSFNYGNENAYQQLLNSILNQEAFSYDPQSDASYSALRKTYLRDGERASANALAQAAASSGGQISSHAAQAAQQANSYYAAQLAGLIPTLEQNAYQRYLGDLQSKMNNLGVLQSDREQEQESWQQQYTILQNALNNLLNDRNFGYQQHQDQYAQLQNTLHNLQADREQAQQDWLNGYNILQNNLQNLQQQDATDYQRYLAQVEQNQASAQYADQLAQQKYENALALYQLLGYATPEVAEILGLNNGSVNVGAVTGTTTTQPTGNPGSVAGDGVVDNGTLKDIPVKDPVKDPTVIDTSDFTVTNRSSEEWVTVGNGRMAWPELKKKVESGEIVENIDYEKGTITYTPAKVYRYNVLNSSGTVVGGGNKSVSKNLFSVKD